MCGHVRACVFVWSPRFKSVFHGVVEKKKIWRAFLKREEKEKLLYSRPLRRNISTSDFSIFFNLFFHPFPTLDLSFHAMWEISSSNPVYLEPVSGLWWKPSAGLEISPSATRSRLSPSGPGRHGGAGEGGISALWHLVHRKSAWQRTPGLHLKYSSVYTCASQFIFTNEYYSR